MPAGRRDARRTEGQMAGTLYLVGTPIGNLSDISERARSVLARVAVCYAEDTRRTGRLLARLGLKVPLRSLHAHNEAARTEEVLGRLLSGQSCAIVSNAGTPVVSDPGRRVVQAAHDAACPVVPIPGPSAVSTAVAASGLPADRFLFLGFPPRSGPERREWLAEAARSPVTVIAFESPRRLERLLASLGHAGLGERQCAICRELTKLHEEIRRGTIAELREAYRDERVLGEVTVVIEGGGRTPPGDPASAEKTARELAAEGWTGLEIARHLREGFGLARNEAYRVGVRAERGAVHEAEREN